MDRKFKIGDKVKIVNKSDPKKYNLYWTPYSTRLIGTIQEIVDLGYNRDWYMVDKKQRIAVNELNLEAVSNTHPHKDLIIAWTNGATIEIWQKPWRNYGGWKITKNPIWKTNAKYRVGISKEERNNLQKELREATQKISDLSKRINEIKVKLQ